jgi:hypothetical protein
MAKTVRGASAGSRLIFWPPMRNGPTVWTLTCKAKLLLGLAVVRLRDGLELSE